MPSAHPIRPVSVLVVGGCGHWAAAENHIPAILALKATGAPVRVSAICDPRDPHDPKLLAHMPHLDALLQQDRPAWIRPRPGEPDTDLEQRLHRAHRTHRFDAVIVACNPVAHYPYLKWATEHGIHVLCDKPILCVEDAAWHPERAAAISHRFDTLLRAHRNRPDHHFAVPLRRRANDAFVHAGDLVREIHDAHKQPLTMGRIDVAGGHYRLPAEYALGDAHGYRHGVGALSFSSYHYLDELTRYLQLAPGPTSTLRVTLQYVRRVGDHLASGLNDTLAALLPRPTTAEGPHAELPERVLRAELDFGFTIELLDPESRSLGVLSYTYTSNSLSNRTVGPQSHDTRDEVAYREKGRMSQFSIDLHQGNLQHLRITKSDAVGEPYTIHVEHRRNPLVGGIGRQERTYRDAHTASTVTPRDITNAFLTLAGGGTPPPAVRDKIAFLDGQVLTHRLYAAMYELIAAHHHNDASQCPSVLVDLP
ncbi:Gfo/Idh/MocA family oxidoreductase [Kitasatospora purpeofusca]|uniref:Gfo/Idh/MocA family oxidoreductase n=1 Tax=Kitasatospora purpeofusca TaxID=67352 RepID=UPI0035DD72A6